LRRYITVANGGKSKTLQALAETPLLSSLTAGAYTRPLLSSI
jgi:hypothetical protein